MNDALKTLKAILSHRLHLPSISYLTSSSCGWTMLTLECILISKENSNSAAATRRRQTTNQTSIAVKIEASNSRAEVDILVRMRNAVMSNPILPGIEDVVGIKKLKSIGISFQIHYYYSGSCTCRGRSLLSKVRAGICWLMQASPSSSTSHEIHTLSSYPNLDTYHHLLNCSPRRILIHAEYHLSDHPTPLNCKQQHPFCEKSSQRWHCISAYRMGIE